MLFAYASGAQTWRFQRDAEVHEVKVDGSLVSNHSEILRQACLDNIGLILMPTWLIGQDIRSGRLQAVLTDFHIYPSPDRDTGIYALYLPNRRYSPRVQVLVNFLIQQLSNPPD